MKNTSADLGTAAPRLTQAERRDRSERELIAAAIKVVAEQGVSAATFDAIAEREDIGIATVTQRCLVDIDEPGCGGERARPDEIGRGLRRHDMDHVELFFDPRDDVAAFLFKCRNFGRAIDRNQLRFKI